MNRKILLNLGIGAIALAYVLNLSYAADNYGIKTNSLSWSVLAQSGSSGGSSGGGGGNCEQDSYGFADFPWFYFIYECKVGSSSLCAEGTSEWYCGDGPCIHYYDGKYIPDRCRN